MDGTIVRIKAVYVLLMHITMFSNRPMSFRSCDTIGIKRYIFVA